MADAPVIITEADVKDSNLLLRGLRKIVQRIGTLSDRLSNVEQSAPPPTPARIRSYLEAQGPAPLNVQSLLGVLAQPQLAGAPRYTAAPTDQVLQQLQDTQLILVGTTAGGYALNAVIGGNPTSLYQLISGLSTATVSSTSTNLMTLDTVQTSTGAKTLQGVWTFQNLVHLKDNLDAVKTVNGGLSYTLTNTSTGNIAFSNITLGADVGTGFWNVIGSGFTTGALRYGLTLGARMEITAFTGLTGMIIGTQSSLAPIFFGVNNILAGQIDGDRNFQIVKKIVSYNGDTLAGNGVGTIVARATGNLVSAASTTNVFTPPVAGEYTVSCYAVTQTTGGGNVNVGFTWVDDTGTASRAIGLSFVAGTRVQDSYIIRAATSGAIALQLGYTGPGAFAVYAVVQRLS